MYMNTGTTMVQYKDAIKSDLAKGVLIIAHISVNRYMPIRNTIPAKAKIDFLLFFIVINMV